MVRMKLTVCITTCMTWSNFKDLQHNASWCEIQWNVRNSRLPHTTCTFYLTFVATPAFFAITDGALSVAIPTARDQCIPILFSTPTKELKMSLAVMASIIGTNPRNSSVTDKVSSTPRMNMACCATSEMPHFFSINSVQFRSSSDILKWFTVRVQSKFNKICYSPDPSSLHQAHVSRIADLFFMKPDLKI